MKKHIPIILSALLLCGCTQNDNAATETTVSESAASEILTEEVTMGTAKAETTSAEAIYAEIEMSETTADSISERFTYDGENPMLKTVSQISERLSMTVTAIDTRSSRALKKLKKILMSMNKDYHAGVVGI